MTTFAIKMKDGSVGIMETVSAGVKGREAKEVTPWECVQKWPPAQRDAVIDIVPITRDEVPIDRTYRNAWTYDGKFDHDMTKAREIHRNRLRAEREPLLVKLDADWMRASEVGDSTEGAKVIAAKKKLRDAPANPAIDAATTVEELKAITLEDA